MAFDNPAPTIPDVLAARAAKLLKIRQLDAQGLAALKLYYKEHPVDFINDWGMTYDPRNPEVGLPTSVPFVLFKRQGEFVEWVYDRWKSRSPGLTEKSRDMGISWCCIAVAVHMWLFYPETVVGFGSRKEEYVDKAGDPKSLFWKARFFISKLPREFRPKGWDEKKFAPSMRIANPENGAVIVGEAGDNIGRGNRTSIYFKDESAFYEQADSIEAALSQTTNCTIDVSTPNGTGNPFARKRHSGKISVFTFHWRDDPRKGEDWAAKKRDELDPVIFAQEVEINYSASVNNSFIDGALVEKAFRYGPADVEPVGLKIIGIDAAHFGDDRSVITYRRGRLVTPQWVIPEAIDGVALAGRVVKIADDFGGVDQIVIELDGPGVSCYDQLRQTKYRDKVVGVHTGARRNDSKHFNLRAVMWARMKEWVEDQPCVLPNNGDLKAELTAMQYSFKDGLLLMEKKSEFKKRVKRSPDLADSLALTFAHNDAPPVREQINRPAVYHGANGWMV